MDLGILGLLIDMNFLSFCAHRKMRLTGTITPCRQSTLLIGCHTKPREQYPAACQRSAPPGPEHSSSLPCPDKGILVPDRCEWLPHSLHPDEAQSPQRPQRARSLLRGAAIRWLYPSGDAPERLQ